MGQDVFVDVDTGVNTAISKIRQVLRDSPDAPAFVETVPGKGYPSSQRSRPSCEGGLCARCPQPGPSPAPNLDVSGNGAEPGRRMGTRLPFHRFRQGLLCPQPWDHPRIGIAAWHSSAARHRTADLRVESASSRSRLKSGGMASG